MQLHEVAEVTQVVGAYNANNLLAEGWKLIAVVPAAVSSSSGPKPSAMYVLGRAEASPKAEADDRGFFEAMVGESKEG